MAVQLPPIPNNPITDVFVWRDWFYKVSQLLVQQASIAWSSIDFTGSNLLDIQTRQHNALQNIQGGIASQYYHLSQAQYNSVAALPSFPIPFNQVTTTYGSFSNTADQLSAADNTATVVALNTTDTANNMTLATNQISVDTIGIYNLQFSSQFQNAGNADADVTVQPARARSNVRVVKSITCGKNNITCGILNAQSTTVNLCRCNAVWSN